MADGERVGGEGGGRTYIEFLQREHMFEYDDFIPFRAGFLQGLRVIVVPVGEFAKVISSARAGSGSGYQDIQPTCSASASS